MEQSSSEWAGYVALIVESIALGVAAFGAVEAFVRLFQPYEEARSSSGRERIEE
jgi:hypothetical protein